MEKLKKDLGRIIGFVSRNSLSFLLGLALASGLVYAWNAVWHGTGWVGTGKVIKSQEIAENFEYLYKNTVKSYSIPVCTGPGKILQYNGKSFICSTLPSNEKGCSAGSVTGNYLYHDRCASRSVMYTVTFSCPVAKHAGAVTCTGRSYYISGTLKAGFKCVNGVFVQETIPYYGSQGLCPWEYSCFTKDTLVTMSDGSKKPISKIVVGDKVLGKDEVVNTVKGVEKVPLAGRKLYSINNSKAFVTPEHPFLTKEGWKAISPEDLLKEEPSLAKTLKPKTLQVGDVLITESGEVEIKSLTSTVAQEQTVYNLILDGNNTYYADGFLVHNKGW